MQNGSRLLPQTRTGLRLAGLLVLLMASASRAADAVPEALRTQCTATIERFKAVDPSLKKLFTSAAGYVVFPRVTKGGFIVGGARGDGLAYEKGAVIGKARLTQVTVGAQVGAQEFSEVVFLETREALEAFKASQLSMNAQVGAVAAAEGAARNARYREGMLVFTRARQGLMAEASVGGQKLKFTALP